jgi:3-oxoacyl-[acyl-carrier-protein] synthase II
MNARDIRIRGVGAVSAAGWNAEALYKAVRAGTPLPATDCKRPGDERTWPCETRRAPAAPPEKITRHPRLRRSSAITRYSVTAALEALADAGHDPAAPPQGLGILFIMMNGCVNYTGRFYHEVLQNPAQASPLIFPETVFNAPASHIASFLGIDGAVSTLVGSPNSIMEALDTAAFWITSGIVEECLLIAAEECDWLSAEALTYYHPKLIASEGAGALLLSAQGDGPRVREIIGPMAYLSWRERGTLLPELAAQTRAKLSGEAILIDDRTGIAKLDHAEAAAWSGSPWNAVLSPKLVLGESMGASAALQLVLGTFTARETQQPVVISMPGTNTAAYACVISL